MTASQQQIERIDMDNFEEVACPTSRGIVDSLKILRKRDAPFSALELADRRDLLFLPFLSGIATLDERVSRLKAAFELAADRLPPAYELVYRRIFLDPTGNVSSRRERAIKELRERFPAKSGNETPSINSIERRLLPRLADILLDQAFAQELDNEHPKSRRTLQSLPLHAFQVLSYTFSFEIDNHDYRKSVVYRKTLIEALVPDQRVATIRYQTRTSNPMPVKDSVKMLSDGHTYLGTLPDGHHGAIENWMLHFVHLGNRKDPGDTATVEMTEELFDEKRHDPHPCITMTIDHGGVTELKLAIRLPEGKLDEAAAEYRVIKSPHSNSVIVENGPLTIKGDRWIRTEFTELEMGLQYGIFLTDFELYK